VTFAYDEGARPALDGISLSIKPGERVALVGSSGSGKSTVANLLLRFIQPNSGQISIDALPLHEIDIDGWRDQVAWVSQQPYLFNRSVADNIRIGRPDAPQEDVIAAAQAAEAHDFITQLEHGYDTVVGERGARLSGGQAQRVALARAFLKDAPFVILDEATANLDPDNEARIEAAIERLMQGRTVLVIAHRLNTIYHADQIYVMEAGRILESGTHEELLQHPGAYHQLVKAYEKTSDHQATPYIGQSIIERPPYE
jgi:ABC-type multidrug transport system fused ATPase/permease subunit